MALVRELLDRAPVDSPDLAYCSDCLAQAAGLTLEEDRLALEKSMRGPAGEASTRLIRRGVCSVCGRTDVVASRR